MPSAAPLNRKHILVIDPAMKVAEVDCFNELVLRSPLPLTYHLPGLFGTESLKHDPNAIAGIIILGSASSVHDGHTWQHSFSQWLMPLMERGVPTLGLCFGHQMVAHLFDGRVDFLHQERQKRSGFRQVRLQANELWGSATEGDLVVSHRETVVTCPVSMAIVGKSDEVAIEALAHKTLPIWTFQSHPEATAGFLRNQGMEPAPHEQAFAFGHRLMDFFLKRAAARA